MKPRTEPWARIVLHMLDHQKGWRSYRAHHYACHVVNNFRLAKITRFRETTGWRVWS